MRPIHSMIFLLLLGGGLSGCRGGSSSNPTAGDAEPRPTAVRVARAAPADFLNRIDAVGRVEPDRSFVLAFKTAGVVRSIAVEPGDTVTKGQVLAELDPKDVDAQLRQAEETADKAERDLGRTRQLHAKGFASDAALQDAIMQADWTRPQAAAARANKGYAAIVAPNQGVVLKRHLEANAVVAAGSPVLTISDLSQSYVLFVGLADRDAVRVSLGDVAEIAFDAFPDEVFAATVSEIGADADPRMGTFAVKLKIAATPERLRSGLIGRAAILPARKPPAVLAIPIDAILEGHGQEAFVFVLDAETSAVRRTRIKVGPLASGLVAVTGGLGEGDAVVVDGAGYLTDGEQVAVSSDDATQAAK